MCHKNKKWMSQEIVQSDSSNRKIASMWRKRVPKISNLSKRHKPNSAQYWSYIKLNVKKEIPSILWQLIIIKTKTNQTKTNKQATTTRRNRTKPTKNKSQKKPTKTKPKHTPKKKNETKPNGKYRMSVTPVIFM